MLVAFDPSINYTGYAIHNGNKIVKYGVLKTKGNDKIQKLYDLELQVNELLTKNLITQAVVEEPGSFFYKRKTKYGTAITPKQLSDALIKCNMAYSHICTKLLDWSINTVSVIARDWKGGRTKAVDMILASDEIGVKIKTDHEADAIMLCVWYTEREKKNLLMSSWNQ